jgi:hypothetical protein
MSLRRFGFDANSAKAGMLEWPVRPVRTPPRAKLDSRTHPPNLSKPSDRSESTPPSAGRREVNVSDESEESVVGEITVDKTNLYREESFSDLKVASIRRLTPVREDGSDDADRDTLFIGETTLMSQRGPLPVQAPIEAKDLTEAFEKFPEAVNQAVEQLIEQAREMQRQEASRIVVPGQGPASGGPRIIG